MEHKLDISIQARYYSYGNPQAKTLLLALHGYGQLGAWFLKKFESLDPDDYYVVVPEGLHRFYLSGASGRVGASWMTKEDRETDIANYIGYLDAVLSQVNPSNAYSRTILLGFSQGGATASRYLALGKQSFTGFILWAAVFPQDMEQNRYARFQHSKNFLVVGDQDKYYKPADLVIEQEKLADSGMKFELIRFQGDHTLEEKTLKLILDEI